MTGAAIRADGPTKRYDDAVAVDPLHRDVPANSVETAARVVLVAVGGALPVAYRVSVGLLRDHRLS